MFLITAAQRALLSARLASARTPPWTLIPSPWAPSRTNTERINKVFFQAKRTAQAMGEQLILMAHPAERTSILDNNSIQIM